MPGQPCATTARWRTWARRTRWPRSAVASPSSRPAGRTPRASSRSSSIASPSSATVASSSCASRLGVGSPALDVAQRQPDGDQALLRTVVQVALQPTPLLVARGDDSGPRLLDLGEAATHLDPKAGDLYRKRTGLDHALEQIGARRALCRGRPLQAEARPVEPAYAPGPQPPTRARPDPTRRRGPPPAGSQKKSSRVGSPVASAITSRVASGTARPARRSSR
jgi:hypothetical protein